MGTAVYATTAEVDGSRLRSRLHREAAVRRIFLSDSIDLPEAWGSFQTRQFAKLCERTGLPEDLRPWVQHPSSPAGSSTPRSGEKRAAGAGIRKRASGG